MDALQHERIISSAQFQRGSLVAALIPAAQHKTRRRDVTGSEEAARTLDYGGYLVAIRQRNRGRRRTGRPEQGRLRRVCEREGGGVRWRCGGDGPRGAEKKKVVQWWVLPRA